VHGIKGITYTDQGLWDKESQKLFEMINQDVSEKQISTILNNIQKFRWHTNGTNALDSIF
jgi:hemerythrin-like domain-containing protein